MNRNPIDNGIDFAKKNPTILYSIFLIIVITAIIFFNSYYSLRKFEDGTDKLLQSKALLGGEVFNIFVSDFFADKSSLEHKIKEIEDIDSEIKDISIFKKNSQDSSFEVLATTTDSSLIEDDKYQTLYAILWSKEQAIASLDNDENGRFWNIADIIRDRDGNKIGISLFRLSLSAHDKFSQDIINSVYFVTIFSLVIVLLIIINHARLFKYELKATKLEEIDKMKDDFISMASHELKSPLTAIKGYADLINDGLNDYNPGKKKEYLRYINNIGISVTRLRDLVEDILEVSRLEQNRLPIESEEVNLVKVVRQLVDEMKIDADNKKLEIINSVRDLSDAKADKDRVKQILVNLISNSIKYTPSGKIEIKGKKDDKFVYITVADTGLGMSSESMSKLFTKFYRISTDKTSGISGTGLGLWISKEIAMKMGGDLSVESIEGVGSHFTLKLKKV